MLTTRTVSAGKPPATDLVAAMVDELIRYPDRRADPQGRARRHEPAGGGVLVIFDDDRAVAGGGLNRLDDEDVRDQAISSWPTCAAAGWPASCLVALEDEARRPGLRIARLDRVPSSRNAQRMYRTRRLPA